ncbi:unnamed protein product [Diamesa tonsa]
MKVLLIILTLCTISLCDELPTIEKFFHKFGQYEFKNDNNQSVVKSYYASREMIVTWLEAFVTCKSFNMDLVELPSEAEADYLLTLLTQQHFHAKFEAHIGASYVGVGLNEFYWMTTGQPINYTLKWARGQPDNKKGIETFLTILREGNVYKFNDMSNIEKHDFICQRFNDTNSKPDVEPNLPNWPNCDPEIVEWFPHPFSCEKFILCFHGNPIEKTCAPSLHFSGEQGKCISSQLPCCPQTDDAMNPLFVADKNNCSKYYVCFSGKAIERSCGEGLFFDVTSNLCTFPENVTCIN